MGVKPTSVPTWATDTNYTGGVEAGTPTKVAPTAGRQAEGWEPAAKPPAQEFKWRKKLVYLWTLFLNQLFTDGGGATGNLDVGVTAEANLVPLAKYRDYLTKIRSTVDHNGYRMGQVSELDEDWRSRPITVTHPISAGEASNGAFSFAVAGSEGLWRTPTASTVRFSLGTLIPQNAIITAVEVNYERGTAGDSTTIAILSDANGNVCAFTDTTSTGSQTVNIIASATSGHGPLQHLDANGLAGGWSVIAVGTTVTVFLLVRRVRVTYLLPPVGWDWTQLTTNVPGTATTGDEIASVDPQSGFNHRAMKITGKAVTAIAGSSVLAGAFEAFHNSDCAYVLEFMLKTGTITDGTDKRLFAAGIQNNNAGALNRFVYFYTDETFANWQLRVVGSSTADTTTGVAVAAATVYRMRLEIYGSAVNSSGNTKIRAFINGVLVVEVNSTTLPAADMIRPYFKVGTNGTTGGPYDCTIGRVRRVWNHLLTPDNL